MLRRSRVLMMVLLTGCSLQGRAYVDGDPELSQEDEPSSDDGALTWTAQALTFGDQEVGTVSAPKSLTISNSKRTNITITGITVTGPFSATLPTLPVTLGRGQSITVSVAFAPTSAGAASGRITLQKSGGNESATLSGNGVSAPTGPSCGDGTCDAGEDCALCAADCGACVAADTTAPTVSLTSPASATTYTTAQTLSITASATDNIGVSKVEFYDGATLKSTDVGAPYTYAWTFSASDNGAHVWTAKAYDAAGNSTTSSSVTLTVSISTTPSPSGEETASAVFLWGTAETANSGFFTSTVLYPGYGSHIQLHNSDDVRFAGQSNVRYHLTFPDLTGVSDPMFSDDTSERVELHAREGYQALGVTVGSTAWIGWSQMYSNIDLDDEFTDFQIRSQAEGVTGSPAAEFYVKRATRDLYFRIGSTRRYIATLEEGAWYDFVLEYKYSYDTDGYARVWAAKAGTQDQVQLLFSSPTAEITGTPTMHNGTTFLNTWADSDAHKYAKDTSPHLRWGVYAWEAHVPEALNASYTKYLSTVRMKVGNLGADGFNAVLPRASVTTQPAPVSLAIGKPTKSSSRYLLAHSQYGVDGRTNAYGASNSGIVHTQSEAQPWMEIDLEAPKVIEEIVIWATSSTSRLNGIKVMVSSQPFNCSDVNTCLAQASWSTSITTAQLKNVIDVPGHTGRYIRLQLPPTGSNRIMSLAEVEVF